jgi:Uma2 family endonuclease
MDAATIAATEPIRPLSRAEYDQLVESGAFEGEHVELLWGVIVPMSPQGAPHSWSIGVLTRHFAKRLPDTVDVRVQMPFAAGPLSEPEPDLVLAPLTDESRVRHPETAWLVVEVARTSHRIDRKKLALYAAAGVPETWIVDLVAEHVEVHSDPHAGRYRSKITVGRGGTLVPTAFPDAALAVDAVLP